MDAQTLSLLCIVGLIVFMMLGVPIVYSLGFSAMVIALVSFGNPVLAKLGMSFYHQTFNLNWTPLPLFVLLGAIIAESGMGKDLFKAAANWLSRIKGGLVVAGIIGEALLAATLGTSAACIIVVGKVAVPEFDKQGYDRGYALGALLAGGVLGPLIPPSATMIIYAVLAQVSLGRLFIAGIIPGLILVLFLAVPAVLMAYMRPRYAPKTFGVSWGERFRGLKGVWPIVLIMGSILGSIYAGIATPSETAGVGCVIALIIAVIGFGMRWKGIKNSFMEAATVNSLIMFIMVAANFFTYVIGSSNVADKLLIFVQGAGLSPIMVIIMINIILLILGCIIDPITITLLTLPIFLPIISELGMDPIWFGILFVVNTQIGLITPPMGTDLFAVKTIFNIPTNDILRGVTPFLIFEVLFLVLLIFVPQVSLWLPNLMIGG